MNQPLTLLNGHNQTVIVNTDEQGNFIGGPYYHPATNAQINNYNEYVEHHEQVSINQRADNSYSRAAGHTMFDVPMSSDRMYSQFGATRANAAMSIGPDLFIMAAKYLHETFDKVEVSCDQKAVRLTCSSPIDSQKIQALFSMLGISPSSVVSFDNVTTINIDTRSQNFSATFNGGARYQYLELLKEDPDEKAYIRAIIKVGFSAGPHCFSFMMTSLLEEIQRATVGNGFLEVCLALYASATGEDAKVAVTASA